MRKLKLDVHALRVESFDASAGDGAASGTVHGAGGESFEDGCSAYKGCSGAGESCAVTACLTCLCPHTGPQPSCDPCSWMDCTWDPATCP